MPNWFFAMWAALGGCYGIYMLLGALRTGTIDVGPAVFEKEEEPGNYWGSVILCMIVTVVAFWMSVEIYRHPF